ncbi:MAG: AraC family transcriptional regulator [Bacteroidetes bacterium]|nr:AraC family transcriptional regulator [Bacteroidota bacterium]
MKDSKTYGELKPNEDLKEFVHSFWMHQNTMDQPQLLTIFPDSFFKIIFLITEGEVVDYFMTGIWTGRKEFITPPNTTIYGCRLKILAPEFLINAEITSILDSLTPLDLNYLNLLDYRFDDFESIVRQWEDELKQIRPNKPLPSNKLEFSQLLYKKEGGISVSDVSEQVFWSSRQINRYLKKYIGIPLKTYLNIQKCYASYGHISDGELAPKNNFFDQAHFIKEVKKRTGETPKTLYLRQNDRFIQLRNIQRK